MPSIYVASLSDYNAGRLHGRWIDVERLDAEDIQYEVDRILETSPESRACMYCGQLTERITSGRFEGWHVHEEGSEPVGHVATPYGQPAEEWAIHDFDGFFGLPVGEWTSFETIAEWARVLTEVGDDLQPAFGAYVEHTGDTDADEHTFFDHYRGEYDDMADYAAELAEETGMLEGVPDWLQYRIDWHGVGHDLEMDGYWSTRSPGHGVYVFSDY